MEAPGQVVLFISLTLGFAWLARRLLGADRVSWRRALVAGAAGCASGVAVAVSLNRWGVEDDGSADGAAVVTAILVSLAIVVALQLVSRPARPDLRGIGVVATVRSVRRLSEVTRIATRHGLGGYVGPAVADELGALRHRVALSTAPPPRPRSVRRSPTPTGCSSLSTGLRSAPRRSLTSTSRNCATGRRSSSRSGDRASSKRSVETVASSCTSHGSSSATAIGRA